MTAIALTIAGSDSSGGAGIQADLKTFAAHNVYGASAITALTAQNTRSVDAVMPVPADFLRAQIAAVRSDLDVNVIKIGMMGTSENIRVIAEEIGKFKDVPVILDPVMAASSGKRLLEAEAIEVLKAQLLPRIFLITPNLYEVARLLGEEEARNVGAMKVQAAALQAFGPAGVLITGGHGDGENAEDVLFDGSRHRIFSSPRLKARNSHGTGCTFSAAIAAGLAHGRPLEEAISQAKEYMVKAITHADSLNVGHGSGPLQHFF